jgi:hypothetical protein
MRPTDTGEQTVPPVGFSTLQRLFAGHTQPERALGLRFVPSKAAEFSNPRIDDGVARDRGSAH